jgi:hypothetical protein
MDFVEYMLPTAKPCFEMGTMLHIYMKCNVLKEALLHQTPAFFGMAAGSIVRGSLKCEKLERYKIGRES